MKIFISLSAVILFLSVTFFSSSCTKETVEVVHVTDTVKLIYQDSMKVDFVYAINYSKSYSDSAEARISAVAACINLPSNATYEWHIEGPCTPIGLHVDAPFNFTIDEFISVENGWPNFHSYKGNYVLSLSVYCPDIKRTYSVAKTLQVKLKY